MSVPASQRKENKLAFLKSVDDLVSHTLKKLENPRKFGEVTRVEYVYGPDGRLAGAVTYAASHRSLAARIEDAAVSAADCAYRANDTVVRNQADYEDRHYLQNQAVHHVRALLYLLNYARSNCGCTGREVAHWVGLAVSARDFLIKWRDADRKRYSGIPAGSESSA